MNGITIVKNNNCIVCYIDSLSKDLKTIIKEELRAICHGKVTVVDELGAYSYKNTLEQFFKRYDVQPPKTKKGMIGELLAHLLINRILPELTTLSIFFNKEEPSVKKGFDLTYVDSSVGKIWYGEVKSGGKSDSETPDTKNIKLLKRSKTGLLEFFSGKRSHIWESVLIDAALSLPRRKAIKAKELLSADYEDAKSFRGAKKNAILISVLFSAVDNKITHTCAAGFKGTVVSEGKFADVVTFSIQKSTYSKIEKFLRNEAFAS